MGRAYRRALHRQSNATDRLDWIVSLSRKNKGTATVIQLFHPGYAGNRKEKKQREGMCEYTHTHTHTVLRYYDTKNVSRQDAR